MANTTNFNWETPDDTDLVKDGAAAIRTLGSAIDTSLVDLKGGTTGQVLSKATNTDMDFTWVAQDDSNAIQNAIVDAKGDLIAASAADTPARLAVGTNGQVLTADSSTATGLKWASTSSGSLIKISTTALSGSSGSISNCFSATYDNYVIVLSDIINASGTGDLLLLARTGSTNTTSGYDGSGFYINGASGQFYQWTDGLVQIYTTTTYYTGATVDLHSPYSTKNTVCEMMQSGPNFSRINLGTLPDSTSYESLGWTVGTGTITGNLTIYGLEK